MKKKTLALMMAMVVVFGVTVAGTLAWLTDSTDAVVNTFTTSDVGITLIETTGKEYQMVPGKTIKKDPKVTVKAGSEDCYLFIEIKQSANYGTYLEDYVIADGWTAVPGVSGVYYRTVSDIIADQAFSVLKDNAVAVKTSVTKTLMKALTAPAEYPTLTFTAYAIQANHLPAGSTVPDIWALASTTTTP